MASTSLPESTDKTVDGFVHAWGGGGYPKVGPVPGHKNLHYSQARLYQHVCGHVEEWAETTDLGPINEQGCDACESAPYPGAWQPLYRKADSYAAATGGES